MARRLISNDQVLAGMLQDPAFRAECERTALARAVAALITRPAPAALRVPSRLA